MNKVYLFFTSILISQKVLPIRPQVLHQKKKKEKILNIITNFSFMVGFHKHTLMAFRWKNDFSLHPQI